MRRLEPLENPSVGPGDPFPHVMNFPFADEGGADGRPQLVLGGGDREKVERSADGLQVHRRPAGRVVSLVEGSLEVHGDRIDETGVVGVIVVIIRQAGP